MIWTDLMEEIGMLSKKFRNIYNLNPPRTDPMENNENIEETRFQEMVDEHLYEEKYSLSYLDLEEMRDEKIIEIFGDVMK